MKLIPKMIDDVLRNLFKVPNTVPYPKRKVAPTARFRGMIEIDAKCIACGACAVACPAKCIKFDRKSLTYWLPHCISCGRCADVCPVGAVIFTDRYEEAREDKELYAGHKFEMAKCEVCGKDTVPVTQKKYMIEVKKLDPKLFARCAECKNKPITIRPEEKPPEQAPSQQTEQKPSMTDIAKQELEKEDEPKKDVTFEDGPPWVKRTEG
ncbi:MAG: 4Fe-4S dicluster domain-containing protein [Candidatus Micrarchaeota archaeon]